MCPCGSNKKYKKCCKIFHNGTLPKTALELMKSRYSAYAVGDSKYIMNTTHILNTDYSEDKKIWEENIQNFIKDSNFNALEILEFEDGTPESFVTFKANIDINGVDSTFTEKSKFIKENEKWLYVNGDFNQENK